MKKLLPIILILGFLLPVYSANAVQKITAGSTCKTLNQKVVYLNKTYTCTKSGKKLVWNKGIAIKTPVQATQPATDITTITTPEPVPDPFATPTPTPTPTPTKTKPAPIKYKNCTEAKAAGVTPIRKSVDPELYALNTALDGDKDGDACES